jgi:nicotinate-nucleotide adenylyltransferase
MKILVFGGSFDPPHQGHIALLKAAARQIRPQMILIVPAYQAPLKGAPHASASDRLKMIRLGLLDPLSPGWRRISHIELHELKSRRQVFTVETLKKLRARFPRDELHFAVGSDAAASLACWKNPEVLKSLCLWWAAVRPGENHSIPDFFRRLQDPMPKVSSTEIRATLSLGAKPPRSLASPVAAYIKRQKLYGGKLLHKLKKDLSPERFHHTLAMAQTAGRLAERWAHDGHKARLAGLLHDCGRSVPVPLMASYSRRHKLKIPAFLETARRAPLLFHAYISADLSQRRYGVKDPEILDAIRYHTLGQPGMSPFERLIYVADCISGDRSYPGVASLRRLALRDMEKAFRLCVLNKLKIALSEGVWLHPAGLTLWNSLQD